MAQETEAQVIERRRAEALELARLLGDLEAGALTPEEYQARVATVLKLPLKREIEERAPKV